MEHAITAMRGTRALDIRELADLLKRKLQEKSAELVSENWRTLEDSKIVLLSFEKFYWRNSSYAGLTVMLTECGSLQTADIIGFGGGSGLLNFSLGANTDFAKLAENLLSSYGFEKS